MIEFKEISKDNVITFIDLAVHDYQKDQVAPNAISIAQGNYSENAWFRGIYNGEEAVGFVMLFIESEKKEYGVWRFMIDKNHQGKGYGREAMNLIKEIVKEKYPDAKGISLSYVPKEKGGADEFYRKVGYVDTGKMSGKEKLMWFEYDK